MSRILILKASSAIAVLSPRIYDAGFTYVHKIFSGDKINQLNSYKNIIRNTFTFVAKNFNMFVIKYICAFLFYCKIYIFKNVENLKKIRINVYEVYYVKYKNRSKWIK